ncbi:MAG: hypothetical protein J6T42_00390, partial [Clostridia bacterium]|nr:hypothetical protein [Clostridia bacterium]
ATPLSRLSFDSRFIFSTKKRTLSACVFWWNRRERRFGYALAHSSCLSATPKVLDYIFWRAFARYAAFAAIVRLSLYLFH